MTNFIKILGSGAAPGVPSVSDGFGVCNPDNSKNYRTRTTTYFEYMGNKFLIDTSPDLRTQMLNNEVKDLDFILYTHSHADHLHGIDDLREITRIKRSSLNIYAAPKTLKDIKKRFSYLMSTRNDGVNAASLIPNKIKHNKPFYINGLKICAVPLLDHIAPSVAYVFNDGEVVYISDCKYVGKDVFKAIKKEVKVLILPLTNPHPHPYHLDINDVNGFIEIIKPKKAIINHMSTSCDYNEVNKMTNNITTPSFDGMKVEVK